MNPPSLQRRVPLLLVVSLHLGLADCVRGQALAASSDLPALRVAVASVNESRNRPGPRTINLTLSITGEGLPPNAAVVKQITVTKAVDNLGNVLSSAVLRSVSQSQMMANFANAGGGARPLTGQASLDGSVRKAESLTYVEGTIELFLPSETNGSMIRIPNVLSHAGRIEHPALARHGIEFYFLPDQASYDRAKNQVGGFQAGALPPAVPNGVGFTYRDPSNHLATHQLQEANGTPIRMGGFSSSGNRGTILLLAPLPADAQLVFFLAIPEATKTVPFRVEEIALP